MKEALIQGIMLNDIYACLKNKLKVILIFGFIGSFLMGSLIYIQKREYVAKTTYIMARVPDIVNKSFFSSGVLIEDNNSLLLKLRADGELSTENLLVCGFVIKENNNIKFDDIYKVMLPKGVNDRLNFTTSNVNSDIAKKCLNYIIEKTIKVQQEQVDKITTAVHLRIKEISQNKNITDVKTQVIISNNGLSEIDILSSFLIGIPLMSPKVIEPYEITLTKLINPYSVSRIIFGFWIGVFIPIFLILIKYFKSRK
jgi:hypothetical protein